MGRHSGRAQRQGTTAGRSGGEVGHTRAATVLLFERTLCALRFACGTFLDAARIEEFRPIGEVLAE
ncbi:hypothetical protein SHIRM173S_09924 [Streptomyces hirsutus]